MNGARAWDFVLLFSNLLLTQTQYVTINVMIAVTVTDKMKVTTNVTPTAPPVDIPELPDISISDTALPAKVHIYGTNFEQVCPHM